MYVLYNALKKVHSRMKKVVFPARTIYGCQKSQFTLHYRVNYLVSIILYRD